MAEQAPHEEQPGEQAADQRLEDQAPPPGTTDLLRWCISVLTASAWQNLGLVPNPATNKIERNLDNARLAIDATAALIDLLKPQLDPRAQRELDTLLTNLRINFVEQKSRAEASPGEAR